MDIIKNVRARARGRHGAVIGGALALGLSGLGATNTTSVVSASYATPKIASQSWYVSWANADDALARAEKIGCAEAERTNTGVLFIGFGRQIEGGASSFGNGLVRYSRISEFATAYARGLSNCSDGTWIIAIMTSNDHLKDTALAAKYGELWGQAAQATNSALGSPRVEIAAGIDVEPAWGPFAAAKAWADNVSRTGARLVFGPSADGCPTDVDGPCNNGWNTAAMGELMWGYDERTIVMPQVYRLKMAQQWANIERVARARGKDVYVDAVLTQNKACRVTQQRPCYDLGPIKAQKLASEVFGREMPFGSDISW
jgi:hypothetical protein